jgi:uroporphyrinogen decarboxylase
MTSKELVMRTLEFAKPERIPRQLWLLPWALQNHPDALREIQDTYPDDILHVSPFYKQPPRSKGDLFEVGDYIDEWGSKFTSKQRGIIGEVKEPLVKTWADLSKVVPPVACLSIDKEKVNDFCTNTDKFVLAGCCPRPFERLQFLRGTENVMMDLAMKRPEITELIDRIHQFYTVEFQMWARTEIDAMMFMDDWGSQSSLLISPDMWREIFKPLYADYIEIAHSHGKKVFMHSDGYITDIIPDLIEIGLDAINCQIFCMDMEQLSQIGKGKITFWGEIDRQHLLPHGSKEDIVNAVKDIYGHLYADGGVIGQLEFGPGAKPENVAVAFEAWNGMV